ncbi:hypothetical protein V6N11_067034 [Hibiscus sabdariffa]|uniref:Uncharacterized protein n=1 Tax=Hibiscus sabdariffa TaxID=183260 RepID=A0ABR2SPL0_9ROSI
MLTISNTDSSNWLLTKRKSPDRPLNVMFDSSWISRYTQCFKLCRNTSTGNVWFAEAQVCSARFLDCHGQCKDKGPECCALARQPLRKVQGSAKTGCDIDGHCFWPPECLDDRTYGFHLKQTTLGSAEKVWTVEGSERRTCCRKGYDGNLRFVSQSDNKVGLH